MKRENRLVRIIRKIVSVIVCISAALSVVALFKELKERNLQKEKMRGIYADYIKRFLDVFLATVALIALSPVYLAVAVLVRLKLGSPVIFKQERPGKKDAVTGKEKIFCLYKFRSMTDERDADGNLLPDEVRLTKFGKWLRSTSLDELPELVNIIKGDMSIVGPRPLLVSYLPYYTEEERRRHDVRPGLTGLAQVNGRNYVGWDNRLTFDVNYVDNVNLFNDVKIVIKTIQMIVLKKDIATDTSKVETNFAQERQGIEEL